MLKHVVYGPITGPALHRHWYAALTRCSYRDRCSVVNVEPRQLNVKPLGGGS
jgi:hypothetical protein